MLNAKMFFLTPFALAMLGSCKHQDDKSASLSFTPAEAFGWVGLLKEDEFASQVPDSKAPLGNSTRRDSLGLSLETFRGVQLAQSYTQEITESQPESFLKKETIDFSSNITPFKLVSNQDVFVFPFSISANSAIFIGRNFSNQSSAASSGPFRLQDLPINVENAEKMSTGDYVAMPVKTSVLAGYNGQTLQQVFQKSGLVKNLISSSGFGSYGAALQGSLVGSGDFTFHILKVAPHKVRVRISLGNSLVVSGGGSLSAGGNANVSFLPHSVLEHARDIGAIAAKTKKVLYEKRTELTFNKTFQLLNPNQKKLGSPADWNLSIGFMSQLGSASQTSDTALSQIPQNPSSMTAANDKLTEKAKLSALKNGAKILEQIDAATKELETLRSHSFQLPAKVSLNASESRVLNSMGEYIFDLSTREGKEAFLYAVSGRSKWIGDDLSTVSLSPAISTGSYKALSDFTYAERIAAQDQQSTKPRVKRVQLADSRKTTDAFNIQFSFANASMGFSQDKSKNQFHIVNPQGQKTTYNLQTWRFQKKGHYAGLTDSEIKSSGFYTKSETDLLAAYYYSWSYEKSNQPSALRDPLKQLLNVLGPEFYRSRTHLMWPIDYSGSTSAHFEVVVNRTGISRFFNESQISEDILWKALGQIAGTWDNTFGLPFNTFGGLSGANSSEEAKKSCVIITKEWGGAYCKFFEETFIPNWHIATKKDALEQVRFFSDFYKQGFLANKIGADLMMRLVLQVLNISRKDPDGQDYMLKVQSTPKEVVNTNQVLDYEFGSDPLHAVSEVLGLSMLML
ncbi:MAG: hypothetical protein WCI18_01540 [Pseudomonadota bacterium]